MTCGSSAGSIWSMSYVATYRPTPAPFGLEAMRAWALEQFGRIADLLPMPEVRGLHLQPLAAEPARIADGDLVYADGSNWNPGSGAGVYCRISGAWVKL